MAERNTLRLKLKQQRRVVCTQRKNPQTAKTVFSGTVTSDSESIGADTEESGESVTDELIGDDVQDAYLADAENESQEVIDDEIQDSEETGEDNI